MVTSGGKKPMCEGKRSRYGCRHVRIGPVLLLLLIFASFPAAGARSEPAVLPSIWNAASGTKGAVHAHRWAIETTDPSTGVGGYASLRLFPSDRQAAIAYYDAAQGDLKYAYHNGEVWQVESVDLSGDVGQYASLALDAQGRPRVAYYDATDGNLKYAFWTGSSWAVTTVDAEGDVGGYASLALYDSLWPRIAYYDATEGDLKYAWNDGVIWNEETVDPFSNVGQYASLALDASGLPHIAYYDAAAGNLRYAWKTTTWQWTPVDTTGDVGSHASLALDASGLPHIAYYDATNGDLKYAHYDGGTWQIETVDGTGNVGRYASLALDAQGLPHIAYYDATHGDLKYAHHNGALWQFQTVYASGIVGLYASLALDTRTRPYIAFRDNTASNLKWAYSCWTPDASFEVSSAPYCAGNTIALTNTTVSTWTVSYLWSFGDGVTSTLKNPTHVYTGAGLYPVVLTAITGCGEDVFSRTLPVWDVPHASFAHSAPACVGLPVFFTSTSQLSGTTFYTWEFGDKTGVVTHPCLYRRRHLPGHAFGAERVRH